MNLKKSDKIIVVIGVLILIIAAIAIVAYTSTEDAEDEEEEAPEEKTFYVTWAKQTREMSVGNDLYAGKNEPYEDTVTVTLPPADIVSVLTRVEFELSWEDDKTVGLLSMFKRGKDKLTAEIGLVDGESETQDSTAGGNMTFSFNINNKPYDESVNADDASQAEQIIRDMFSDEDDASFDVTVNVKPGERLRRPLKFLRDRGNDFELKVTYEYYSADLEDLEPEEDDDDEKSTGDEPPAYLWMMVNAGSWSRW